MLKATPMNFNNVNFSLNKRTPINKLPIRQMAFGTVLSSTMVTVLDNTVIKYTI